MSEILRQREKAVFQWQSKIKSNRDATRVLFFFFFSPLLLLASQTDLSLLALANEPMTILFFLFFASIAAALVQVEIRICRASTRFDFEHCPCLIKHIRLDWTPVLLL